MLRATVEGAASLFEAAGTFAMAFGALIAIAMAFRDRGSGGAATFKQAQAFDHAAERRSARAPDGVTP
jgi:hypothetical protein